MQNYKKLNLGAGKDIRSGYINHDIADISNIDVVHDLNQRPWPFEDSAFDEIIALDVLEHLDDFLPTMEELYRILAPCGTIKIKVPYWNSSFCHMDPTHKQLFHEMTFHFLDPEKELCKTRNYYTSARFNIIEEVFVLIPFAPYLTIPLINPIKVRRKISKRIIGFFGNLFSNIILDLEIVLKKTQN
jgi:SAM-dependent methyltransferase